MESTTENSIFVVGTCHGPSLRTLLSAMRFDHREYANAEDFFSSANLRAHGCVISDFELAGIRGLDFLRQLQANDSTLPLIIVSGPISTKLAVRAMHEGASTVLVHPFETDDLYFAIRRALDQNKRAVRCAERRVALDSQFGHLSQAEKQVLENAWLGRTNREIATSLDISVRTVEARKKRLLAKTQSESATQMLIEYHQYQELCQGRSHGHKQRNAV